MLITSLSLLFQHLEANEKNGALFQKKTNKQNVHTKNPALKTWWQSLREMATDLATIILVNARVRVRIRYWLG